MIFPRTGTEEQAHRVALTPSPSPTGWERGVGAHGGASCCAFPLARLWERGTYGGGNQALWSCDWFLRRAGGGVHLAALERTQRVIEPLGDLVKLVRPAGDLLGLGGKLLAGRADLLRGGAGLLA